MSEILSQPLGKRARKRIERPREILAAALSEFMAKGYAAARVEDIAATVGVTKGTVYFYFESKEKLFAEVIRGFSPAPAAMKTNVDADAPIRPQLDTYVAKLFALIAKEPESRQVFHLLISEGRHFPDLLDQYFVEFLTPALDQIRTLLKEGSGRGEFAGVEPPMPEVLIAPAVMANIWVSVFAERRPLDIDGLLSNAAACFLRGAGSDRGELLANEGVAKRFDHRS